MPFFGDAIGTYLVPRILLEILQQPDSEHQAGVCAASGYAWVLQGQQLYIWRYREGKDARLRTLSLPRAPSPAHPPTVVLIAHGPGSSTSAAAPAGLSASGISVGGFSTLPSAPGAFAPATADGPLSVAVCDADGHLTVWLDAHHLASPVEHQLLVASASAPAARTGHRPAPAPAPGAPTCAPLVAAFAAARLDLGTGPAFLAALSASDGSFHVIQVGCQGIFSKQLAGPVGADTQARGYLGAIGSALSRAVTDAFDPSARYLRKQPSPRPALALHVAAAPGGGGQHYRVLVLTADSLDCWAVSVGLRPHEALQWSFLNTLLRAQDSRRGVDAAANLAFDVAGGEGAGGQRVAVWMAESGRAGRRQHVVQMLELMPEGGPAVVCAPHDAVEGYQEPLDSASAASLHRQILFAPRAGTCLLLRWHDAGSSAAAHSASFMARGTWGMSAGGGAGGLGSSSRARALYAWSPDSGAATRLSEDPDTAAVGLLADGAASGASDGSGTAATAQWVLLSATYGVVEVAGAAAAAPAASASATHMPAPLGGAPAAVPLPAPPGDLDPAAATAHMLDALLSQAAAIAGAGGNLQPLVSSLERRLGALGALGSPQAQAAIARYSAQLLDLLPKQWAAARGGDGADGGGGGAAGGAGGGGGSGGGAGGGLGALDALPTSVSEQLAEKESRHALLLQCLALGGVLHTLAPGVLRALIENSEKLAVAVALHRLQAHQRDTAVAGAPPPPAALLLARLVAEAGRESGAKEYEVLTAPEIFYARPTASVEHFVGALGRASGEVAAQAGGGLGQRGDSDLLSLRATVRELGSLVALTVSAAVGRREALGSSHHLGASEVAARLGAPDWLAGAHTRGALEQLARAIQAVRPRPPAPPAPLPAPELSHTLFGVTDVLLTCFASAVAASRSDPAARGALVAQYRSVRGGLLDDLLADAACELRHAAVQGGQLPHDLLVWQVEALCRVHHCYAHLFDACEALGAAAPEPAAAANAAARLHAHMATQPAEEGAPPDQPSLARYVFGRLLDEGRPADLLELPQQFHDGITSFLQSRQPQQAELLSLHLLRTGALGDAAAVLQQHVAAVGGGGGKQGGQPAQAQAGGQQGGGVGVLGSYRRLLSIARLAARAGGSEGVEGSTLLQLRLLGLQARLGHPADSAPLEPAVLLDEALAAAAAPARGAAASTSASAAAQPLPAHALGAKEAAVVAVEVLALMPAEARAAHASKWQMAWKAVYDADPWDTVAAERAAAAAGPAGGGGGGGDWGSVLEGTAAYRAVAACGGSDALGFGATVVDSAPLDQVARWLRSWALNGGAGGGPSARSPGGGKGAGPDPAAERRVDAVMAALRLGVEAAAAGREQQAGGRGAVDMLVD